MNRKEFMKTIIGGAFATLTTPLIANANQETKNGGATVEYIKGFERGFHSCFGEIRRQTKFSPKKCLEYDGVMYIAGIRGCVL